mgnify:CR=1 FL=1
MHNKRQHSQDEVLPLYFCDKRTRIKHTTGKHTEKDGWNVPASGNTLTQRYANARYHIAINAIPREQSFICNFLLLNKKIVANERIPFKVYMTNKGKEA